ncbi:hypothetical protein [Aquipuribacter hungaricus]|uniref:hypothetical protein n=1 Tax=Aquipuribacter hungaricus TaxID=545624 RepID=UPI0036156F08
MNPLTYTPAENSWTWTNRRTGLQFSGPLHLAWEVASDPISDDYTTSDISSRDLLRLWLRRLPDSGAESAFGAGAVTISWYVTGEPFEGAPFPLWRYGDPGSVDEDFLTFFSWPVSTTDKSRVNFLRLPVEDKALA